MTGEECEIAVTEFIPPRRTQFGRSCNMQTFPKTIRITGVDLAWGDPRPNGFCVLEVNRQRVWVLALGLPHGDDELLAFLNEHLDGARVLIAMDAPVVCHNLSGARPVDRLAHVHFGRFKAGSHPCNLTRCRRPARVAARLVEREFTVGT